MKRIASFGIPRQICRGRAGSVFLLPLAVARCEAGEKPASKHALLAAGGWRPERGGGRGDAEGLRRRLPPSPNAGPGRGAAFAPWGGGGGGSGPTPAPRPLGAGLGGCPPRPAVAGGRWLAPGREKGVGGGLTAETRRSRGVSPRRCRCRPPLSEAFHRYIAPRRVGRGVSVPPPSGGCVVPGAAGARG